ncbi:MAG: DUF6325 family protein [Solirubrobacterales bacterium]
MSDANDVLGPIEFLVIGFPDGRITEGGFPELERLAAGGTVRVLDVEFVRRSADGVQRVRAAELDAELDLSRWEGAASGLLDREDLDTLTGELEEGAAAVMIVIENRWVLDLADRWQAQGGRLLADGGLHADDVVAALDASDDD